MEQEKELVFRILEKRYNLIIERIKIYETLRTVGLLPFIGLFVFKNELNLLFAGILIALMIIIYSDNEETKIYNQRLETERQMIKVINVDVKTKWIYEE